MQAMTKAAEPQRVPVPQVAMAPSAGDAISGVKPMYPSMALPMHIGADDRPPWEPQTTDKAPFGALSNHRGGK